MDQFEKIFDDMDIRAEIDNISERINAIVNKLEQIDPNPPSEGEQK